jgi:hypothetical protein
VIVPKLLHVVVQPVFVLVDSDTFEVSQGPQVQPNIVPATALDQIAGAIEETRQAIAEQLSTLAAGQTVQGPPVETSPDAP